MTDVGHRRTADRHTLQGGKGSPFYSGICDCPHLPNVPDAPSQNSGQTRHPGRWCEWTHLYVASWLIISQSLQIPQFSNQPLGRLSFLFGRSSSFCFFFLMPSNAGPVQGSMSIPWLTSQHQHRLLHTGHPGFQTHTGLCVSQTSHGHGIPNHHQLQVQVASQRLPDGHGLVERAPFIPTAPRLGLSLCT